MIWSNLFSEYVKIKGNINAVTVHVCIVQFYLKNSRVKKTLQIKFRNTFAAENLIFKVVLNSLSPVSVTYKVNKTKISDYPNLKNIINKMLGRRRKHVSARKKHTLDFYTVYCNNVFYINNN